MILALIAILIASVGVDQLTKLLAESSLKGREPITLIPRVFALTYTTNKGVAGGVFSGNKIATLIVPLIGLIALCIYLFRYAPKKKIVRIPIALILGGGIGNLIDRIFRAEVIDFISMPFLPWFSVNPFRKVDFPIFNVADICVTVGAVIIMVVLVIGIIRESVAERQEKKNGGSK